MLKRPFIILLSLCVFCGCALLASLGFWQLSRYQQKTSMIQDLAHNRQAEVLQQLSFNNTSDYQVQENIGQRVKLTGHFQNNHVFLLDNQILNGKVGYLIIVPFDLGNHQWILVNRGWLPAHQNRNILPIVEPILDRVTIEGYLQKAYRTPINIATLESNQIRWPLRIQQIDTSMFADFLKVELHPNLVRLQDNSEYSLQMPPMLPVGFSPERHLGYAVQWFALCLTLLAMYIFSMYRAKAKEKT